MTDSPETREAHLEQSCRDDGCHVPAVAQIADGYCVLVVAQIGDGYHVSATALIATATR